MSAVVHGSCHCGNIGFTFRSALAIERLPLRSCACSFCSRHGARTTTDARGTVEIAVDDPSCLIRYRFALRTADFLVCGRCGIYVAAVLTDDGRPYATVNANTFDREEVARCPAEPVDYSAETFEERRARRVKRWTPVTCIRGAA
jgi:hypothetical protein